MGALGKTVVPAAKAERIAAYLATLPPGTAFTVTDIRQHVSGVGQSGVSQFLTAHVRLGQIERIGCGRYRSVVSRIRTRLPLALVADSMWLVLASEPSQRFISTAEVIGETESLVGRSGVSLRNAVRINLHRWFRSGHLERVGVVRAYSYRVRDGVSIRPVLIQG